MCLLNRDGKYTSDKKKIDDFDNMRNTNINDYTKALKALEKKGYTIFRMGKNVKSKLGYTSKRVIDYVGVEAYPVTAEEVEKMNFISVLKAEKEKNVFEKMHAVSWEEKHQISETFSLLKRKQLFENIEDEDAFNLIYFDAFGARVQPELWSEEIFRKMFNALKENGVLTTYSAKGSVRRAMQAVGFTVERLPGPPGKREMLRAIKRTTNN